MDCGTMGGSTSMDHTSFRVAPWSPTKTILITFTKMSGLQPYTLSGSCNWIPWPSPSIRKAFPTNLTHWDLQVDQVRYFDCVDFWGC